MDLIFCKQEHQPIIPSKENQVIKLMQMQMSDTGLKLNQQLIQLRTQMEKGSRVRWASVNLL
jgi:hypothetical protein